VYTHRVRIDQKVFELFANLERTGPPSEPVTQARLTHVKADEDYFGDVPIDTLQFPQAGGGLKKRQQPTVPGAGLPRLAGPNIDLQPDRWELRLARASWLSNDVAPILALIQLHDGAMGDLACAR